jgi:hypothetical protein
MMRMEVSMVVSLAHVGGELQKDACEPCFDPAARELGEPVRQLDQTMRQVRRVPFAEQARALVMDAHRGDRRQPMRSSTASRRKIVVRRRTSSWGSGMSRPFSPI